jgi:hypothetical protein
VTGVLIRCSERCVDLDMMTLILFPLSKFIDTSTSHLFERSGKESAFLLRSALAYPLVYHTSMKRFQTQNERYPLSENLRLYAERGCSDFRDKVYTLLNISQPINIKIDYCTVHR